MKPYTGWWSPFLICVACSSEPTLRTYVLTPALERTSIAPKAAAPAERIVVPRVLVPDYLDTTDILMRVGSNEVKVSATARWGERLSQGITHAIAADLVARMPSDSIETDITDTTRRQLLINVNALELWPDGRCAMVASWTLVDRGASQAAASGGGVFDASPRGSAMGVDDARLVDAISYTVDELANAIALNIRQSVPRSTLEAQ